MTRSVADGYTLLFSTISTFVINGILIKNIPYDVNRDLELVGIAAVAPYVLAVRTDIPAQSVHELIALAKKQPGRLSFASAGSGTILHMAGEQFKHQSGIDFLHVPFKAGAPALVGVLSNEVDMIVTDLSAVLTYVKSGRLRALAAPAKTPRAVIARLKAGHAAVLARADYIERLAGLAMEPLMMTPEQIAAFVKREIEKWQKVVTAAGVRID